VALEFSFLLSRRVLLDCILKASPFTTYCLSLFSSPPDSFATTPLLQSLPPGSLTPFYFLMVTHGTSPSNLRYFSFFFFESPPRAVAFPAAFAKATLSKFKLLVSLSPLVFPGDLPCKVQGLFSVFLAVSLACFCLYRPLQAWTEVPGGESSVIFS